MIVRASLAFMLAVAVVLPAGAQFRSGVEVVNVDVLVRRGGRPVRGLQAANFELFDNGVRQRIETVAADAVPLNIMLVLDVSSSTEGQPLRDLKDAARAVVSLLRKGDRMALLTFSSHLQLRRSWTDDVRWLQRAIDETTAEGATSLRDAIFAATSLRDGVTGRVLVIVFSDGHDTASWLSVHDVLAAASRTDLAIHAVQTMPVVPRSPEAIRRELLAHPLLNEMYLLTALSHDTGGEILSVSRSRDVRAAFVKIVDEFRSGYVLMYSPQGVARAGWHPLEVRLSGARGEVRARRGYSTR